jgi:hypothetical protein
MASRLIVPFDNNPSSTTQKSSSYTIPAGKYAYVQPQFYDFTLNGVSICVGATQTIISSTTLNPATSVTIGSLDRNQRLTMSNSAASQVTLLAGGFQLQRVINNNTTINIFEGIVTGHNTAFSINTTGIGGSGLALHNPTGSSLSVTVTGAPFILTNIWVPTGSVLNGTRFMVTEYNAIS